MKKRNTCSCGRSFTTPQGLGQHFRHVRDDPGHHPPGEHTGWVRYRCADCDLRFNELDAFELHLDHKHPGHRGENARVTEQPAPKSNDKPAVWPLVVADMNARDAEGRRKYGVPLQPFNGRDVLIDAYQEALDLCVYLRQAIYERDAK